MIRVIIADDHHIVRHGICALLAKASDIEVVAEAEDGQQAVELTERLNPDVLVVDISMPRLNGIEATERVRALRSKGIATQVVILSMHCDEALVRQALRNGAKGYLLKRSVAEELPLAIRAATHGETYLTPGIAESIVDEFVTRPPDAAAPTRFESLTARERQVLQLIAEGRTNKEIADLLQISVKTVEKHRTDLMAKLDVHDVAGLTRVAIKHGLVSLE